MLEYPVNMDFYKFIECPDYYMSIHDNDIIMAFLYDVVEGLN